MFKDHHQNNSSASPFQWYAIGHRTPLNVMIVRLSQKCRFQMVQMIEHENIKVAAREGFQSSRHLAFQANALPQIFVQYYKIIFGRFILSNVKKTLFKILSFKVKFLMRKPDEGYVISPISMSMAIIVFKNYNYI